MATITPSRGRPPPPSSSPSSSRKSPRPTSTSTIAMATEGEGEEEAEEGKNTLVKAAVSAPAVSIPDDEDGAPLLPLGVSASVLLTTLPRDAAGALDRANRLEETKITVMFKHIGSAPMLSRPRAKISASARFEKIASFLRKQLDLPLEESLFLYVNSQFAPSGDEEVGNLFKNRNLRFPTILQLEMIN